MTVAIPLDQQTPEQHRQRYDALLAQARARSTERPNLPCPPIPTGAVAQSETIPGGWYWTALVRRGQTLRVANHSGSSSVSILLWNQHDTSERLNVPDTVKLQWTVRVGAGLLLLSDMGRAMASITGDTGARHDMLTGGSTAGSNARRYGGTYRNTHDNMLLAAAKHGLDRRDIPPCLTLFADVRVGADERVAWHGPAPAGSTIDLRAEMDLLVALSNCPHPLDPAPAYAPAAVDAIIWQAADPAPDDPCRTAGPEAVRAFENIARLNHG
ncbi:MAG: urea amidolyase associated protein UAAP1 [Janthinobacterium lividum]